MNRCLPTPVIVRHVGQRHDQIGILRAAGAERLGLELDQHHGLGEPLRVGDQVVVEFRWPVELELFGEVVAVAAGGYQALLEVTDVGQPTRYANGFSRPEEQQA